MANQNSRQKMIDNFLPEVNKRMSTGVFLIKLFGCRGNLDRIDLVRQFHRWIPPTPQVRENYKKRSNVSTNFRSEVLLFMKKGDYPRAIRSCNKALLYAETQEDLDLVVFTRAKLLFDFGHFEEALRDLTIKMDFLSSEEQYELATLKSQCEKILKEQKEENGEVISEKVARTTFSDDLFRLKSSGNPLAPSLEDFVQIRHNSHRGRHLVATKVIPAGTTLLVEKPFVVGLEGTLENDIEHCHHCLRRNLRYIPCPDCVFAMFCDEKCLKESMVYHKSFECSSLPDLCSILKDDVLCENFYLVFKLICIVGPAELFRIFEEESEKYFGMEMTTGEKKIDGMDEMGIYGPNYLAMCRLFSVVKPEEGYFFPLIALMLSNVLDDNTTFFQKIRPNVKTDFRHFVASVILHHFECFRRNIFGLGEVDNPREVKGIKQHLNMSYFSSGCFPTASLVNHSCYPNVERFIGPTFGEIALVSIKSLSEGEELVISYSPILGDTQDTTGRRLLLSTGYNFNCECIACKFDWTETTESPKSFCCYHCSLNVLEEMRSSREFLQCLVSLNESDLKCSLCGQADETILNELTQRRRLVEICNNLVLSNSPLQTIKSLKFCMEFFQRHDIPPSQSLIKCQKIFRDAIHRIIFS